MKSACSLLYSGIESTLTYELWQTFSVWVSAVTGTIWKAMGQKGVHKGKVLKEMLKRTRVLLKKQTHQNKKVHEVEGSLHSSLLKPGLFLVGPCPSPNETNCA